MALIAKRRLQFAVVREDPRVEERVVRELAARRVLIVGSGGCTALHLRARFPGLEVTLVEPNPAQLEHLDAKLRALAASEPARFGVGDADPAALHECGAFEHVFRLLRTVLDLFVVTAGERRRRCADPRGTWDDVVAHPYWPVAFATAFSDDVLVATFGPAAVQHAPPRSYPAYFQRRIEAGLRADDRAVNPWLHHVLLGHYLEDPAAWPPFLREPPRDLASFPALATDLLGVSDFAPYDLVGLSNVPDWMDDDAFAELAARLARELRPGAGVLWRQLNDPRDLVARFPDAFDVDARRDAELTAADRSLFYDQVHLLRHR